MDLYLQYDENLSQNPFLKKLQTEHKILLDTAPLENWIICIPRAVTVKPEHLSNPNFLLAHILIPNDELPETHFTNLLGLDIHLEDKKLASCGNVNSMVLFEEDFYTKGLMKYKVWCVEQPLLANQSGAEVTNGLFIVRDLKDAFELLWNETNSKAIFRKIDSSCTSFSDQQDKRIADREKLRNSLELLYNHNLQSLLYNKRLKEKCRQDLHFYKIVKIALETYMMNKLYKFLFDAISICHLDETESFNKVIRNLADCHISDFNIDTKCTDLVASVRSELLYIEDYSTAVEKLGCLRRALNATSRNYQKNLSADDLIPILVFVIIKSGLTHWISTLTFLKDFIFTDLMDVSTTDNFLISTLEAAITYIKTINFNAKKSKACASLQPKLTFLSKNDFLDYLFNQINLGCEEEVLRLLRTDETIEFDKTDTVRCHPLCNCDKCNLIIENGNFLLPNVNSQNQNGIAAIHVASMNGQPKIINILLALGADLTLTDENNWTALHYAAARGHQNALLLLLHAGISINAKTNDNFTALHWCCLNGHQGCVKALLYHSDHMSIKIEKNSQNKIGDTPLHLASKWGFIEIIDTLLEYGVQIDRTNRLGHTATDLAHNSFITEQLENVFIVIENDLAEVTPAKNNLIPEPFRGFIDSNLMSSTAKLTKKTNIDKIIAAIRNGDTKLAYYFLGITDVEEIGEQLTNACHPLCNCTNCAQNINSKDVNENSCSSVEKIEHINDSNSDGITPLLAASESGNKKLLDILLKNGASISRKTNHHQTALHLAILSRHYETTELVLNYINDNFINTQDMDGNTALHLAVMSGDPKLVETLLKHEPKLNVLNAQNQSALDIATKSFLFSIVRMLDLAENGADESTL